MLDHVANPSPRKGVHRQCRILGKETMQTEVAIDHIEASMVVVVIADCLADQNDLVLAA